MMERWRRWRAEGIGPELKAASRDIPHGRGIARGAVVLQLEDARNTAMEVIDRNVEFAARAIVRCKSLPSRPRHDNPVGMTRFQPDHREEMDDDQKACACMEENCLHERLTVNIGFAGHPGKPVLKPLTVLRHMCTVCYSLSPLSGSVMAQTTPIHEFTSLKTIAVVGVSRSGKKFGNTILAALKAKGYQAIPVNPSAESVGGERCYPDLQSIPVAVGGVVTVVPPAATARVVRDAIAAGIRRVWMQQGSASDEAVRLCEESGVSCIRNECILMYAAPVGGIHGFHRWLWRLCGRLQT
jgi:predicted CoA-binding protein